MSAQISKEAVTALEWAFGAYADKDPGIPFDIAYSVDVEGVEPTKIEIDALARSLIASAVNDGLGGRICLGWCTFFREGRFGLGVMALQKTAVAA